MKEQTVVKGKFQRQLEKRALMKILVLIGVGGILFLAGMVLLSYFTNEHSANQNLRYLIDFYNEQRDGCEAFLSDEQVLKSSVNRVLGKEDSAQWEKMLRRNQPANRVKSYILLTGADGTVYESTFTGELSNYFLNYNNAVCFHAAESNKEGIYYSVYYDPGNYSDYILVRTLTQSGGIIGYLSLYLSGSDWNFCLSENNYDGVIADQKNNIIYCSKASFMNQNGKFIPEKGLYYHLNGERYYLKSEELSEYGVTVYSMVYSPKNRVWIVGVIMVCVMGVCWYPLAKSMSNEMAANNAAMINSLVKEIRIIQQGDSDYRLRTDRGTEFDEVGKQINRMLDSISSLNDKNVELLRLNNTFELNQLMAQINPHFLYNTLEMIRNLVLWEPERTSEIILKLTKILRYSIDLSCQEVVLEEDIRFLTDYLDIQKCRFGDRFSYTMEIAEDCMLCTVPKLLLQPMLENSIKYGFRKKEVIHVHLSGHLEGDILKLAVEDDGPGMPREEIERLNESMKSVYKEGGSFGLHNIARRLHLQYGENSGAFISGEEGKGLMVTVSIEQKRRTDVSCHSGGG